MITNALLIEIVPVDVAGEITRAVSPILGVGASNQCDAQVLVWQDMAGLRTGRLPRSVKQYANFRTVLTKAAKILPPTLRPIALEHLFSFPRRTWRGCTGVAVCHWLVSAPGRFLPVAVGRLGTRHIVSAHVLSLDSGGNFIVFPHVQAKEIFSAWNDGLLRPFGF